MITGSFGSATSEPGPPKTDPQHRHAYRAAPDRTEHRCVCRTGQNGRGPRMPSLAERKNAVHSVQSRTEERYVYRTGQNGGPPCTPGRAKQNGTPMLRRAQRNTTVHTGPRQTERNTAVHTRPHQTERKTSTYAAPGGTEDHRACRPGRKGRTPRMPCRAELKTTVHATPGTTEDRRTYRRLYCTGRKTAAHDGSLLRIPQATLGSTEDDNDDAMPGMKKDNNHDATPGMKEDEHDE